MADNWRGMSGEFPSLWRKVNRRWTAVQEAGPWCGSVTVWSGGEDSLLGRRLKEGADVLGSVS